MGSVSVFCNTKQSGVCRSNDLYRDLICLQFLCQVLQYIWKAFTYHLYFYSVSVMILHLNSAVFLWWETVLSHLESQRQTFYQFFSLFSSLVSQGHFTGYLKSWEKSIDCSSHYLQCRSLPLKLCMLSARGCCYVEKLTVSTHWLALSLHLSRCGNINETTKWKLFTASLPPAAVWLSADRDSVPYLLLHMLLAFHLARFLHPQLERSHWPLFPQLEKQLTTPNFVGGIRNVSVIFLCHSRKSSYIHEKLRQKYGHKTLTNMDEMARAVLQVVISQFTEITCDKRKCQVNCSQQLSRLKITPLLIG